MPTHSLKVRDAPTERAFLTFAKQRWRAFHPDRAPRRGHPLERDRLYALIRQVLDQKYPAHGSRWPRELRSSAVTEQLLQLMQNGQSKAHFSEKTIKKYVRMYRLEHSTVSETHKIGGFEWLSRHRSPIISQSAAAMNAAMRSGQDRTLHLSWLLVVRYAVGIRVRTIPSRYILDPTLEGDDLDQAVRTTIIKLGQALLAQHPQRRLSKEYSLPELMDQLTSGRLRPLRTVRRATPRRTLRPTRRHSRR